MLIPIPGLSHLRRLAVEEPTSPPARPIPVEVRHAARALVTVALDAFCGLRPLTQLSQKRFDAPVRAHISARLRSRAPAEARLRSLHIRHMENAAEVCGTLTQEGRITAYAARLECADGVWRMSSFRVL